MDMARRAQTAWKTVCKDRRISNPAARALLLTLVTLSSARVAHALEPAEAASKPPVSISVFLSSRTDVCHDPGDIPAIRAIAARERDRINAQGGVAGHRLDLRFMDDARTNARAIANVKQALTDPTSIAFVGLSNSERAKAVFDSTGADIAASRIPFLSSISLNSIFKDAPNVFTTRASQDDERLPVLAQFVTRSGFQRPAFVGLKDALFSTALGDGLKKVLGAQTIVADHRMKLTDGNLAPVDISAVVADLKSKSPDILFLSVGGARNGEVIAALNAASVAPPIFLTGRIAGVPKEIADAYPADFYELVWDRLPDVYNDRLMKRLAVAAPDDWVFEGAKIPAAPGWAKGTCKERPVVEIADPLTDENLRAIGIGTQYADMIALIAAAARTADRNATLAQLRAHITSQLTTTYASGRGAFQGAFENWSFVPETRTATRTPFIVQRTPGLGRSQLAPLQFARLRDEALRSIGTQYLDIDLIRIFAVNDAEKSFFAEFYLSIREDGREASIDLLEFSNAFLNPQTNDRQLTVRVLSPGGKSEAYPDDMKIYHVSGRFLFEPKLQTYPFDTQRFAIEIRPKKGDAPFIVQPPPQLLRDQAVAADGWEPRMQFVSYDEDFVSTVDAKSHRPSVVPFYKASFVWLMSRQTNDYYLRVVVPLLFILIVAYLSVFIPLSHFEAIVTIQVTALLSAVALYLSLPTIDSDTTTLSDRIFLFNYMAVSLMIGISVARINQRVMGRPWLERTLGTLHMTLVPLLTAVMAYYVHRASLASG